MANVIIQTNGKVLAHNISILGFLLFCLFGIGFIITALDQDWTLKQTLFNLYKLEAGISSILFPIICLHHVFFPTHANKSF